MELKKRDKSKKEIKEVKEVKPVAVKKPKKSKKLTLATICAKIILENPKASFQTLCKKAEDEFKTTGAFTYLITNAMNDALDAIVTLNEFEAMMAKEEVKKDKKK